MHKGKSSFKGQNVKVCSQEESQNMGRMPFHQSVKRGPGNPNVSPKKTTKKGGCC